MLRRHSGLAAQAALLVQSQAADCSGAGGGHGGRLRCQAEHHGLGSPLARLRSEVGAWGSCQRFPAAAAGLPRRHLRFPGSAQSVRWGGLTGLFYQYTGFLVIWLKESSSEYLAHQQDYLINVLSALWVICDTGGTQIKFWHRQCMRLLDFCRYCRVLLQ